jgi:hypothetical protein
MVVGLLVIIILILLAKTGFLDEIADGCAGCLPWIIGGTILYSFFGWIGKIIGHIRLGEFTEASQIFFLGIVVAVTVSLLVYFLNKDDDKKNKSYYNPRK